MKKILLILIFAISSPIAIAASAGGDSKNTASKGVKPTTKFDIGEKWISKAKKFEKRAKAASKDVKNIGRSFTSIMNEKYRP